MIRDNCITQRRVRRKEHGRRSLSGALADARAFFRFFTDYRDLRFLE